MDQEQIDKDQSNDDFNAGFNSVRPSEGYVPPEVKEPVEVQKQVEPEVQEPVIEEPADKPLFAGMTEAQIKSLLERSARVDGIEDQLRKAHGKIGELNGTLQEIKSHQKQPTHIDAPVVDEAGMNDFERDFPEFVSAIETRARRIANELVKGNQQQPAVPVDEIKVQLQQEVQLGIMDAMYPDWRDTLATQDFALWIATQSPEVQETYGSTWSARELGGLVTSFKNSQQTAESRSLKSKQRLEAAITPSGGATKVTHAPTAADEFEAGFNRVRNQRN